MENRILTNSIPFFISGHEPTIRATSTPKGDLRLDTSYNRSLNLFERGILGSSKPNLNLFISGQSYFPTNSGLPLFIKGSTAGYKYEFKTLPLFIIGSPIPSKLNLFIKGSDIFRPNPSSLNLFVGGGGTKVNKSLQLVVWGSVANYSLSLNNLTLDQLVRLTLDELNTLPLDSSDVFAGYYVSNSLDLYISGEGEVDNASVYRTWMNLYLQGGKGSTRSLNLFMKGSPYILQPLDLYTYGILGSSHNFIPLYVFSKDILNKRLNLFVRGYI